MSGPPDPDKPLLAGWPFWRVAYRQTFAAFRFRNYRLWFRGQLLSLMGTWMQMTAQGYLVFELTQDATYLGLVAFAAGIPPWLFMLYAGVVADRMSRRKLLMITQGCMMMLAVILAGITFLGIVKPWHIIVLAFLLGIANAFDAPARLSFVLEMVDREHMTNAIAMNAMIFNLATAVSPAIAGLVYAAVGAAWCFALNALSFVAVLVALALMKPNPQPLTDPGRSALSELREGLHFVITEPLVRTLIGMVIMMGVFGVSFVALFPAWAVRILGGDATTNGLMHSARGMGALAGVLVIAALGSLRFRGRLLTIASLLLPAALLVFTVVRMQILSFAVLFLVGAGMIMTLNLCNSLVQSISPDGLRGRVMGVYSLSFFGMFPLGALLAGAAAERIGEPVTVALAAAIFGAFALAVRILLPRLSRYP
jgi:MFS family permease